MMSRRKPEGYNTHVLIGTGGEAARALPQGGWKGIANVAKRLDSPLRCRTAAGRWQTASSAPSTGESDRVRPGKEIVPPVAVEGLGKVGLEICYDLRFPELHIIQTRLGAQILTFPSAFTLKTGKDHWGRFQDRLLG
jgi:hypothetical protein